MKGERLPKTVGRNFRRLVGEASYKSLNDFAVKNGFAYSTLQALYIGRAIPRLDTIVEIAHALQIKPHIFVREILS